MRIRFPARSITIFLVVLTFFSNVGAQTSSNYNLAAELNAAAGTDDIPTARQVLDQGLDVNYKRSDQTALHYAVHFKRAAMVRFLLERGADPNITDGEGLDALQLAEKGGNSEVVQILRQAMSLERSTTKNPANQAAPSTQNMNGISASSSKPEEAASRRFDTGARVLHSRDGGKTWETGTVLKVDSEMGYLIENEEKTVQNYYDGVYVTTLERQPHWTNFFVGDWNLYLPMASIERVSGNDFYQIFSGGERLPPLRIHANGTYAWVVDKDNVLRGRWTANEGPGLVLLSGYRNDDWILYSTSDSGKNKVYKTDSVRLVSRSEMYSPQVGYRLSK